MCNLSSCCCCFSLRTGSLIIGWLGFVGGFLLLFDNTQSNYGRIIKCVVYVLIYAALLYGIYSEKPTWMLFSIILSAIGIVSLVILGIISIVLVSSDNSPYKNDDRAAIIATMAITYTIILALGIYFTSVLYSFYKQLKDGGIRSVV